ncbi:hypothetical protein MUK42_20481 [Musa troglodytarum]|uniref:Uncharacterized protein n=1 Tax=Musa troglodytarum TaxID=320322 RepID=A0A9E7GDP1_9LILI|nr:hypothetical protein MUK42_20481 [Musa troglodytarum]
MGMNRNYSTVSNLEPWFFLEFVSAFDAYKIKPWIISTKLLLSDIDYDNNISQSSLGTIKVSLTLSLTKILRLNMYL